MRIGRAIWDLIAQHELRSVLKATLKRRIDGINLLEGVENDLVNHVLKLEERPLGLTKKRSPALGI